MGRPESGASVEDNGLCCTVFLVSVALAFDSGF